MGHSWYTEPDPVKAWQKFEQTCRDNDRRHREADARREAERPSDKK